MNRTELIAALAGKAEVSKRDAENVLNAFIEIVEATVKADDKVQLSGFGTFEARARAARVGINPKTKKEVKIPACKVPVFKVGKVFKDMLK